MMSESFWAGVLKPYYEGGVLGTPFKWCGRGPDGYDCWGLVVEVRKRMGMPVLDEWFNAIDSASESCKNVTEGFLRPCWTKTETPEPGDIIGLSRNKFMHHTGILTPWGTLHTVRNFGALVQKNSELKMNGYKLIQPYKYTGN